MAAPEAEHDPQNDATESALEALARARRHARAAAAETLEVLRALLDAASLAARGVPAEQHPLLARSAALIGEWSSRLASEGRVGGDALTRALADALDEEIQRWEERARDDDEARAVLRAFLGLRELLWELGVRPTPPGAANGGAPSPPESSPRRRRRVERVRVES